MYICQWVDGKPSYLVKLEYGCANWDTNRQMAIKFSTKAEAEKYLYLSNGIRAWNEAVCKVVFIHPLNLGKS